MSQQSYPVHPIAVMLKKSDFYRYSKFELANPELWAGLYYENEDIGGGWCKYLKRTPYGMDAHKLAGWKSADDNKKGREATRSGMNNL